MFCPQCGTENTDNTYYCKECGHALTPVSSTPEQSIDRPKYNMDDLYFAATNGNVTEVANILSRRSPVKLEYVFPPLPKSRRKRIASVK